MDEPTTDVIQGTLDMLILKTLSLEPMHGFGIARRVEQISRGVFKVNPGSLLTALQRLERAGWLDAEWRQTENSRRAQHLLADPCRPETARHRDGRLEAPRLGGRPAPEGRRRSSHVPVASAHARRARAHASACRGPRRCGGSAALLRRGDRRSIRARASRRTTPAGPRACPSAVRRSPRSRCEPTGGRTWSSTSFADARYALRRLRRAPGSPSLSVLTLALGIGASTAIFSAVNPILFEPLPYPQASTIITIWDYAVDGGAHRRDVRHLSRSRSSAADRSTRSR